MTDNPVDAAAKVLETGQNLPLPVQVALSNLLTYIQTPLGGGGKALVERLTNSVQTRYLQDGYPHVIEAVEQAADQISALQAKVDALMAEPTHAEVDAVAEALAEDALWPCAWVERRRTTRDKFRISAIAALTAFLRARGGGQP